MADAATALAHFAPVGTLPVEAPVRRWSPATRIAFRFFAAYFAFYVVSTQMLSGLFPLVAVPDLGERFPIRTMVEWTAVNVYGITTPLVVTGSGSGDKMFDWILVSCLLVIVTILTATWSWVSRGSQSHETVHKWYQLFLRFALGTTMLSYGMAKVFPLQMQFPNLARLLEPYGNFSPMGVLWASIGASPSYEILTGCVEASAAIWLFVPRTATLGAVVALFASVQIFALNMTYDVPVKLFSFHLILMSLFLLAPELKRLMNVLVLDRVAGPSTVPPLGATPRTMKILVAAQIVFGLVVVGESINGSLSARTQYGYLAPKSPFYGIWNITYMSIDGVERAPRVDDYERWRRVSFERPVGLAFHRMDDTVLTFAVKADDAARSLALSRTADPKWTGTLSYDRPDPNHMVLKGDLAGKQLEMRLELYPRDKFLLVSRGFNWIQEFPFNR